MAHVALSYILGSHSTYTIRAYYIDSLGIARGYGKGLPPSAVLFFNVQLLNFR